MDDREIVERLTTQADSTVATTRLLGVLAGAGIGIGAGGAMESGIVALVAVAFLGALGYAVGNNIGESRVLTLRAQAAILRRQIERN